MNSTKNAFNLKLNWTAQNKKANPLNRITLQRHRLNSVVDFPRPNMFSRTFDFDRYMHNMCSTWFYVIFDIFGNSKVIVVKENMGQVLKWAYDPPTERWKLKMCKKSITLSITLLMFDGISIQINVYIPFICCCARNKRFQTVGITIIIQIEANRHGNQ